MMTPQEIRDFARDAEFYGALAEGGLLTEEHCRYWKEVVAVLEELQELELEEFRRLIM